MIRVLYVDDEPDLLVIGKLFLEKDGIFSIDTASSAGEAGEKLKSTHYDCIVSDYQMPVMDGISFLKYVRGSYNDLPFILFTGKGREEVVIEALNNGASFYHQKGGEPEAQFAELAHKIRKSIQGRESDREIRESERKYRSVVDNIQDVFYRSDCNGNLIMASPSWAKVLGYGSVLECIGKNIANDFYYHPEERQAFLLDVTTHEAVKNYEVTLKKKDGTPVIVSTNSHRYFDEKGTHLGVEGIFRDISAQKKAEARLGTNREYLKAIVQGSPVPTFVIDRKHRVVSWNKALEEYSGIPAEQMLGKPEAWRAFYPSSRPCMADLIVDAAADEINRLYEGKFAASRLTEGAYEATDFFPHMKGGSWLFFTAAPIREANGRVIGAVEILQDITERKMAEDEISASNEQMAAALEELRSTEESLHQHVRDLTRSEAALRESEQRFRSLFDHMIDGLALHELITDETGTPIEYRILEVNPAFETLLGISRETVIGKLSREAYGTEEPPYLGVYTRVGRDGVPFSFETYFPPMEKYFSISVYSPEPGYFATIFEDITGKKKVEHELISKNEELGASFEQIAATEEELRANYEELAASQQLLHKSRQYLQSIVSGSPIPTFVIDREHRVTSWNRALEDYLGIPADLVTGKPLAGQAFYKADRPSLADLIVDQAFDEIPKWYEGKFSRSSQLEGAYEVTDYFPTMKGGTWLFFTASPIYDEQGTLVGAVETLQDITGRKRAEEQLTHTNEELGAAFEELAATEKELRQNLDEITDAQSALLESEGRFRSAMNQLPGATWVVDRDLRYTLSQGAGLTMIGLKPDQVVGMTLYQFFGTTDQSHPVISQHLRALSGESVIYKYIHEGVSFRTYLSPLRDVQGTITGVTGLAFDITELTIADANLKESEEKYRTLIEKANEAVLIAQDGIFVFANQSLSRFLGLPVEELVGKPFIDFIWPEDREFVSTRYQKRVAGESVSDAYDFRIIDAGGRLKWAFLSAARIQWHGKPATLNLITDITERKLAEEALKESEAKYRLLFDSSRDAMITLAPPSWKFTTGNPAALEMFDAKDVAEFTTLGPWEVSPERQPDGRSSTEKAQEMIETALRDGSHQFEWTHKRVSGEEFPATVLMTRFEMADQVLLQATIRDITLQKRKEDALRENEEKFRSLAEFSPDSIMRFDRGGRHLYMNPAGLRVSGITEDQIIGKTHLEAGYDAKLSQLWERNIHQVFETGEPVQVQFEWESAEGLVVLDLRLTPEFDEDGNVKSIMGVSRDITEIKRVEQALRKANQQLSLLGGITRHDILNKVSVLLGYAALARKKSSDPTTIAFIDNVESATRAIRSQIEFTRVYQDLGTQEPQWQKLDTILPRCHIPVTITMNADVKGIEIFADPMLEKVFSNLLDNSVRHGERVTEIRVSSSQSGDDLKIVWEDNGVGIPSDEKEKIFERGFGKNTGLGMFLVREILTLTGIIIQETGEPGKCARFVIAVPKGAYRFYQADTVSVSGRPTTLQGTQHL